MKSAVQIPAIFVDYLRNRGIDGEQRLNQFLFPALKDLPNPSAMQNLSKAAAVIVDHLLNQLPIVIWGDYDVDGTTGTALLVHFFRELDREVEWHIPNRLEEGYGLNAQWFVNRRKSGSTGNFCVITVDCGISDAEQIDAIQQLGGTVIVTDHHSLPPKPLPDCLIVNPAQPTCGFHGHHLAGVGVAFYLAAGIRAELGARTVSKSDRLTLKPYLAFVALGTVADVVELTPTNRILVRAGLEALSVPRFCGLAELLRSCEIEGTHITTEDIGYLLGPKLNAAGRLGESELVVRLLTEQDRSQAKRLAQRLTALNEQRKIITGNNLETALSILGSSMVQGNNCAIVAGDLHRGTAGIVASRLVDLYAVPAIVLSKKILADGRLVFTGSARSVAGIDIVKIIGNCSQHLVKYGGHAMAAGLTVEGQLLEAFSLAFQREVAAQAIQTGQRPKPHADIRCSIDQLMSAEVLKFYRLLEPFGPGNSQPIFCDPATTIIDAKAVGRELEHLQLTLRGRYTNIKGIGFNLGKHLDEVQACPKRSILFTPTANRYRGTLSWQLRIISF